MPARPSTISTLPFFLRFFAAAGTTLSTTSWAPAACASSHTAALLANGPGKCAEKFGEEAVEAIIEAVRGDRARLTAEAADVIYHLLVMLAARDVPLAEVLAEPLRWPT